jgi:hypothetical protein
MSSVKREKEMSLEKLILALNFVFFSHDIKNFGLFVKQLCGHIEHRDVRATYFIGIFKHFKTLFKKSRAQD